MNTFNITQTLLYQTSILFKRYYPKACRMWVGYAQEIFSARRFKFISLFLKGFPKYEWHNVAPDKRNEALDTFVYALAALRITNIDLELRSEQLLNNK